MRIKHSLVAVGENGLNSTAFQNHARKFANLSLDEKCRSGLDLSAAFQLYTPYVDIIHDGESKSYPLMFSQSTLEQDLFYCLYISMT